MGTIFNIIKYSGKYDELKEVVITYWIKLEPLFKRDFQLIKVSQSDSLRLKLLSRSINDLLNLNIDNETKMQIVNFYFDCNNHPDIFSDIFSSFSSYYHEKRLFTDYYHYVRLFTDYYHYNINGCKSRIEEPKIDLPDFLMFPDRYKDNQWVKVHTLLEGKESYTDDYNNFCKQNAQLINEVRNYKKIPEIVTNNISKQLGVRVDYTKILHCFKNILTTVLIYKDESGDLFIRLKDFSQQYNQFQELRGKMGQPMEKVMINIDTKYTQLINNIQKSTILTRIPYLYDEYQNLDIYYQ
jgi:hypothetical protein